MIQIPRLYDVCKKLGEVACFQVMIAAQRKIINNSDAYHVREVMKITSHMCS